ncbi:MAG TPA: hypothetical protein VGE01_04580 [Fimbriimonas sp.]
MENIRPEDRPKLIALLVAVIVVFGFVGLQIMKAVNPGGSAPTTETVAKAEPAAEAAAPPEEDLIEVPALFASSTLNPFQTVLRDERRQPVAPAAPRPRTISGRYFANDTVPTMPEPVGGDIETGIDGGAPTEPVRPVAPVVKLKGIIYGSQPVAVVEVGGKEYVVRENESIDGGFVVRNIRDRSVQLSFGGTRTNLSLAAE